jgi:transcription-repair coupling factor (superfamily II helicase)
MDWSSGFWHDPGRMLQFPELRVSSILNREVDLGRKRIAISGTSSPLFLSLILSNLTSNKISLLPHLVITPSLVEAQRFLTAIQFFDPARNVEILSGFDVSPYSGLEPKTQTSAERVRFFHRAQSAKTSDIFVAPIEALLQKAIPFHVLKKNCHRFAKDKDLPSDLHGLLANLGYTSTPIVEDVGQYSVRGGIVDIFSPAHSLPVRLELFGDTIESLRHFSTEDQRSLSEVTVFDLIPASEILFQDETLEKVIDDFRKSFGSREIDKPESEEILRSISRKQKFPGIEFLLPYFYKNPESPLEHFSTSLNIYQLDPISISRESDRLFAELKADYQGASKNLFLPETKSLFQNVEELSFPEDSQFFEFSDIDSQEDEKNSTQKIQFSTHSVLDLSNSLQSQTPGSEAWSEALRKKLTTWKSEEYQVYVAIKNQSQAERLRILMEKIHSPEIAELNVVLRPLPESLRIPEERLVFLRDEDLLGKKTRVRDYSAQDDFQKKAKRLSFGDLKPGDCVVHIQHGIGVYDGLRVMNISGVDSEFIQVSYKDKDKLYLPVYRVGQLQRYSGAAPTAVLDKLGGPGWEKTKSKVKGHLRDLAQDLLVLYAKRAELHRPSFTIPEKDMASFEAAFPYDETTDQLRAINDFEKDLTSTKPMDRLICGDVGFGKTEVAMRAAFVSAINKKQVAVLAPTTVLTFQHFETFKKRFKGWDFEIRVLNRFVSNADAKKTLKELKQGKVDILIGTHRLLSKDVEFSDLGLLIVDEEQKFGVAHKEKIKKMMVGVDTLTLSATPIPRTLNMSLMGVRDLSIIDSAPVDRLPTRTFICKFDPETIRKAITSEISRGGQVFFIHNRVQSIYGLADEIKQIVPDARIRVGHGQMEEEELEKTMVAFFNHEIDVLICTTIVESGMDVPRANTMFIDQAHMLGLSQLYQLRGRVGRSKQRAYCYLILPRDKKIQKEAQERLKVIQENTALGSGIRIAQYDLELRGAGNILGEHQSGHINSVGYELYMDLLNEAVHQLKGEPTDQIELDPEINLRIPAMIPEKYISDIRIRLSYYKALADIQSPEDLEKIEEELKDQFGEIPESTLNLMGLMLIRSECKKLGVKDVSAGLKNISLKFSEQTKMKPETAISLAMRDNKKYSINPDNRLNVRMNNITWPSVYEELQYLLKLV